MDRIKSDQTFIRPNAEFYKNNKKYGNDLSMYNANGECLHICGNNDWAYLAIELLKPLLKDATALYATISHEITNRKPEVVLVGKNDFRLLDIVHVARDSEQGISVIKGVPIVRGEFLNGVKFLGHNEEMELPFM